MSKYDDILRERELNAAAEDWRIYWLNHPVDLSALPSWVSAYILWWGRKTGEEFRG
jgi:hypothetical protein